MKFLFTCYMALGLLDKICDIKFLSNWKQFLLFLFQSCLIYLWILDYKAFFKVIQFIEGVYANSIGSEICIKFSKVTQLVLKLVIWFYTFACGFGLLYISLRSIFAENKLVVSIILPGISSRQFWALVFLVSYHIWASLICCVIIGLLDAMIVLVFLNTLMVSSIIEQQIDQFQEYLRIGRMSEIEIKHKLMKLALIIERFNEYELTITSAFERFRKF